MALFGNRIFAGVAKTRIEMRARWVRVDPTPNKNVLVRDRRGYTETQRRSDVTTKAGSGVMCPQAKNGKDGWQLPQARRQSLQEGPILTTPRSQTEGFLTVRADISVLLSHPVSGHLSWEP